MAYDIAIPIKLGLFSFATAGLIFYFFWLFDYKLIKHKQKLSYAYVIFHMLIMIAGLLLTGFITWLQ